MPKLKRVILLALLFVFGTMPSNASTVATTTVLTIAPGGTVNAGTPATLSVTVIDENPLPVPRGQVLFCDANAARCADAALFGTAQLSVGGTAALKLTLGAGTYSIVAKFVGIGGEAPSVSTAQPLTVTGTGTYFSSTAINATGSAANYALTGTTTAFGRAAFSGNISFLDITNANASLGSAALNSVTLAFGFVPAATLSTGVNPVRAAIGDFDGDGIADIAIANAAAGTVSIFLGNGDGTFKLPSPPDFAAGTSPFDLVAADFNGDGILDLAVSNQTDGTIVIFIGQGDGTFVAQASSPSIAGAVRGLVAGDFNHDGNVDLAAVLPGAPAVVVLLGAGDGTFSIAQADCANVTYPVGSDPWKLAAADLNHDGNLDLIVTNPGDATISILLGVGDGTFQTQTVISVPNSARGIVAGDFNGDGFADMAVTNDADNTVTILLNDQTGTLVVQPTLLTAGLQPVDVVAGDFNADGKLDLAAVNETDSTVGVFLGKGDGAFLAQSTSAVGTTPFALALGDFNGDGLPDLISANLGSASASIRLSAQSESATATGISVVGTGVHNVLADYPGDIFRAPSQSPTTPLTALTATTTTLTAVPTSSVFGQSVTFTATVAPAPLSGPAFGTVEFFNGITSLGTANVDNTGVATLALTTLPVGSLSLTAAYSGNADSADSTSAPLSFTVSRADTTTAVTSSLNPSVFGQSITFSATVSPTAPGAGLPLGIVTFLDGGTPIGTGTLGDGPATFTTSALTPGNHTITTSYGGDANFNGSTGSLTGNPQVVNKANSTTAVTSSADPSVLGQSVTFTATVSATAPGAGTPTGTVTFLDGGASIGTGNLAGGVATFATSALAIGSHTITTSYAGDASFNTSTGSLTGTPQVVNKVNTTTAVTSSANPSVFGQSVTFTATVSPVAPGTGTPSGTVTFLDGGISIGTGNLTAGVATLVTSALAVGNHTVTTSYAGDASFNTSTGSLTGNPQVVNKAATTTAVTSSLNASVFGQSVTFTASVSAVAPGAGTPTGTVTFLDGGVSIGTGNLTAGVATLATVTLTPGNHTITTTHAGDTSFNAGTGSLTGNPQVVNKADSATTITSSPNPSVSGQSVTFTAIVSAVAPGTGTPTGSVTFLDGATPLGTIALSAGAATLPISSLTAGNHTITTSYGGDASFNGGTGSLVGNPQVVNKANTTTALTSSLNPSAFGQSVTFSATVSPVAPGTGLPLGIVTFLDGGTPIGTGTLGDGPATFTTSALAPGNHTITTTYPGDGNFNGSTGSLTGNPQVVNKANTSTAVISSLNPSVFGQSATFTATVIDSSGGSTAVPTGSIQFIVDGANFGAPVALTGASSTTSTAASQATATLSVAGAPHTVTANYVNADGSFSNSTGTLTGGQAVNAATSSTTLTVAPNPSAFGQTITLTATVSPQFSGTPTGTVTFKSDGTTIGSPVAITSGSAVLMTAALQGGIQNLTAVYSGDTSFTTSTSNTVSFTVNSAATTTTLTGAPNPSTFGQSVTLTATVAPIPTGATLGTVDFFNGATNIGTGIVNASGVATLTTTALPAGTFGLTAVYSGNTNFATSTSTAFSFTVNKVATTTVLTVSPNPANTGQTVTLTATVAPTPTGVPLGSVDFFNGATDIGTVNLNASGVAVLTTTTLPGGVLSLTATYSGNAGFAISTSTAQSITVVVATNAALTGAPNPSAFGQSVTLTATITPTPTGASLGTVNFFNGATNLGPGDVSAGGIATLATAALPVGTLSLTAVYSGNTAFGASTSPAFSQTVNPAPTTTTLAVVANPSTFGQSVTLTATIAPIPTGAPLGSVSFFNGATNIGTGTVNASGVATLATAALPVGTLSLTAVYSGNTDFATSTSTALSFTVNKVATTTALTASPNPVSAGQTVTLTATITPIPTGVPLGTVDFFNGATNIGTGTVSASGVATIASTTLPQGTLSLTATYSGNTNFATSTSTAQSLIVVTATTTALTGAPNPSTFGQSVTLTATVTPAPTGSPLGTVNFFSGATMLGTGNVNASGIATLASTTLPVGTLSLTAVYSGNAAFAASTSTAFSFTVEVTPTTTTLTVSPNPGIFGQSITFTATIAPIPTGASLGTVTFLNGTTSLGSVAPNSSGVATLATSTILAGSFTATASYSGNTNFGPSTSTGVALTVNTTYAVTAPVTSFLVVQGGSVPITVTVPPQGGPFNNVVTMSATGLPAGAIGTFVPPTVTPGAAGGTTVLTIQLAPLAADLSRPASTPGAPVPAFAFAAGLLLFIRRKHLRRSLRLAAMFMLVILLSSTLMGCAGGFLRPPSTPPGAFMVTITGTSGTTVNSTTVTVVVR